MRHHWLAVSEFEVLFSVLFEFSDSESRLVLGLLTIQQGDTVEASQLLNKVNIYSAEQTWCCHQSIALWRAVSS